MSLYGSVSINAGFNLGFLGGGVGVDYSTTQTYAMSTISTQKLTFSQTTTVQLTYGDIDTQFTYKVIPYLYYSTPGGYLVLDYVTIPPTNSFPPTFWENVYGSKPDPTFNLPYKTLTHNAEKELSRDVRIAGQNGADLDNPKNGDMFTVGFRIKNFSPVSVPFIQYQIYQGHPCLNKKIPGGLGNVTLQPYDSNDIFFSFAFNGKGQRCIYIVLDPDNQVDEVHEDNNQAYGTIGTAQSSKFTCYTQINFDSNCKLIKKKDNTLFGLDRKVAIAVLALSAFVAVLIISFAIFIKVKCG
jgi:hypothetical protein